MRIQLGFAALAVLTALCWFWLWLMVKRPERWGTIVEKENAFWTARGVVSKARSEKLQRLEKGRFQKILVGAAAALGTSLLLFAAILWVLMNR
jgi:hypothetical protein